MVIGCIIQARMGSSRFPGKILEKIDDTTTVLESVINQVKQSKLIEKIVIATTTLEQDNIVEKLCREINIPFYRGESIDVLDRYYKCAKYFSISEIVRITSDNPLIDPELIDQVVRKYVNEKLDYACNFIPRTFPYGTEVEIVSFNVLEKIWNDAKKPSEREHVTSYVLNNQNKFKIGKITCEKDISHYRWTLDRRNDLELIQKIISRIKTRPILLKNILDVFSENPKLYDINKNNLKDEGYKKSLLEDQEYKIFKKIKNDF